jgi:hypothetical protein
MRSFHAFALWALAFVVVGCASARSPSDLLAGVGAVEVANRTEATVRVAIDGRDEAEVPAGRRVRIAPVPAGARTLTLSRAGYPPRPGAVTVVGREVLRVEVLPGMLGDDAAATVLPEPPLLGALAVENAVGVVVRVSVDGKAIGRVMPGETRAFDAVPSGAVLAVARGDDGRTVEGRLEVPAGGVMTWRVVPAGLPVTVDNGTAEAAEVHIDGRVFGRVGPGAQAIFHVPEGLHAAEAVLEPSRRRFATTLEVRQESDSSGQPPSGPAPSRVWRLAGGSAVVVVENALPCPLEVRVFAQGEAGDPQPSSLGAHASSAPLGSAHVAPGNLGRLEGLAAGRVRVLATEARSSGCAPGADAPSSGLTGPEPSAPHATVLHLEAGDEVRWRVAAVPWALRVENRTREPLVLYAVPAAAIAPRAPAVRLGELAAGAATVVGDVASLAGTPGRAVQVEAWTRRGVRLGAREVAPKVASEPWQVRAASGGLVIFNGGGKRVLLRLDGVELGELAPGASLGLGALEARLHAVEWRPGEGSRTWRALVDVPDDPAGERPVRLSVGAPGGPPVAEGAEPGLAAVPAPAGALQVTNGLGEAIAVAVRAQSVGYAPDADAKPDDRAGALRSVEAGATASFDGLPLGPVVVEVLGVTTGRLRTWPLTLAPGRIPELVLAPRPATLIVENRSAEAIDVEVTPEGAVAPGDTAAAGASRTRAVAPVGPRRTTVLAGASRGLPDLAPGRWRVSVHHRRGGPPEVHLVTLGEAERRALVVAPVMGQVRVENLSGEAVSLRQHGAELLRLAADAAPALLPLPAGVHDLEVVRGDTVETRQVEVEARGDALTTLTLWPGTGRLVVLNRAAEPLEVRLGERVLGVVAAGASSVFEGLAAGALLLSASPLPQPGSASGRGPVTQRAALRLDGGQTASWVLLAP